MDPLSRMKVRRIGFIDRMNLFSACAFRGNIYCGTAYKGNRVPGRPGIVELNLKTPGLGISCEDIGPVYTIREIQQKLFLGTGLGLFRGELDEYINVTNGVEIGGGINAICVSSEGSIIAGGDSSLVKCNQELNDCIPCDLHDTGILGSMNIMTISRIPGGLAIGRDLERESYEPAVVFLKDGSLPRLDVLSAGNEGKLTDNNNQQKVSHLVSIEKLGRSLAAISPGYVQETFVHDRWLVVVEFKRTYAIDLVSAQTVNLGKGGISVFKHPARLEWWIAGGGVSILRYGEESGTWVQEADLSQNIESGLKDHGAVFVSTLAFTDNAIFVGTEGSGAYMLVDESAGTSIDNKECSTSTDLSHRDTAAGITVERIQNRSQVDDAKEEIKTEKRRGWLLPLIIILSVIIGLLIAHFTSSDRRHSRKDEIEKLLEPKLEWGKLYDQNQKLQKIGKDLEKDLDE